MIATNSLSRAPAQGAYTDVRKAPSVTRFTFPRPGQFW
jgi:hypothetical protein